MKLLNLLLPVLLLTGMGPVPKAKVMNPGEAYGQLVYLTSDDVLKETPKMKSLSPLSLPVFAELPMDLAVVAGTITLKQQNLVSHVQLKARARHTPNLDISEVAGGLQSALMKPFQDGDWVHMKLSADGTIVLEKSTEAEAIAYQAKNKMEPLQLKADVTKKEMLPHQSLSWKDADSVGAKAANYAELAKALNTSERTVVVPGYALPFFYYQEFVETNPKVKAAIEQILRDPLMKKVAKVSYRDEKLKALRELMMAPETVVNPHLLEMMLIVFDQIRGADGLPLKIKLRSSTNSEDLPNFNGAGLYSSEAYKPVQKKTEKTRAEKEESLKQTLKTVWASTWNLRAFEERAYFQIPHKDVRMGIQINPSFSNEFVDGVVITKNITNDPKLKGKAVYIEAQRGSTFSVANPDPGIKPERILVLVNEAQPLDLNGYRIHILQKSNIADDTKTVLPNDNPKAMMSDAEIKDLVYQVLKAEAYFKPLLGPNKADFALDLEFKVDSVREGSRAVYLKQARPYID